MDPRRDPTRSALTGAFTLLVMVGLPAWLWHDVVADILRALHPQLNSLVGLVPWALILGGIVFLVPVVISAGREPDSRLFFRGRNAYLGWGVSLYILGVALATQVARIHDASTTLR